MSLYLSRSDTGLLLTADEIRRRQAFRKLGIDRKGELTKIGRYLLEVESAINIASQDRDGNDQFCNFLRIHEAHATSRDLAVQEAQWAFDYLRDFLGFRVIHIIRHADNLHQWEVRW